MPFATHNAAGEPVVIPIGGPPGPPGGEGPDGRSAYQIAVESGGDTGSETDFAAMLATAGSGGNMATRTAAVPIRASCCVVDVRGNTCAPADPSDPTQCGKLLGFVRDATSQGQSAAITTLGPVQGAVGNFGLGDRLWIAAGGGLTRVPPAMGWRQCVGVATDASTILFRPERAALYNPVSPLVLIGGADQGAVAALIAAAFAANPQALAAVLAGVFDALPPLPVDLSTVPAAGGLYRDGDANGYRLVRLSPAS
ncbi:hypothetical protein DA075_17215 [Methylobacterium currus]|uniref:Uncharacterized protein n=1 Tax=Methylobacterium currus TaxID=2051553 RepID=A0A2R4WLM6_9HYPH|nr:hypothetical protein [Methylobacterium currus]AWB22439.1 hypothetical protein DA075_17215 [Methylobacterium currus]